MCRRPTVVAAATVSAAALAAGAAGTAVYLNG